MEHWKNKWKMDSEQDKHWLHIEGRLQPLSIIFSSVGILSCMILQALNDFEGGMLGHQTVLAQWNFWPTSDLKSNASFIGKSPELVLFQINLSSVVTLGIVILLTMFFRLGKVSCTEYGMLQTKSEIKSLT